jgi:beta-lactamase regulating signal transducer with metallopeptidase domain
MNTPVWHDSRYWLAAGWTMFHFLWIGAAIWLLAAAMRSSLSRLGPRARYAMALMLLLVTAGVPCGLFVAALRSIDEIRIDNATSEPGAFHESSAPPPTMTLPLRGGDPVVSVSRRASFDSQSVFERGAGELLRVSCRWLPWLWLAGTPLTFLLLAFGMTGADRLRRTARVLEEGEVAAACRRLQAALHVGRQVTVAVCDRVAVPLLVGIIRPVILLPPAVLSGCSPEQIEMILIHELAHVRRWDNLVNLGQRLIEAAFFFHPVIWWLSSWVRLEREQCCDSVVLAHTGPPQVYAETLAALAFPGMAARHAAVALTDSHLAVRIRHILDLEEETMSVSRKALMAAAGLMLFCAGYSVRYLQSTEMRRASVTDNSTSNATVPDGRASSYIAPDDDSESERIVPADVAPTTLRATNRDPAT